MRPGSSPSLRPQDGEPSGTASTRPVTPPGTAPSTARGTAPGAGGRGGAARAAWVVAVPLLTLALAVLFLATSGDITGREGSYPRVLAGLVAVLALLSLWRDRADARHEAAAGPADAPAGASTAALPGDAGAHDDAVVDADAEAGSAEGARGAGVHVRRVLALAGVTVLSVYLMSWLGFFIPAALLVAGGIVVLGIRSPWRVAAYTAGIVVAAHLLFVEALRVPFPPAPWS